MTQNEALREFFKKNDCLTQRHAMLSLGIGRLSERIRELEAEGYVFDHASIKVPTRYSSTAHVTEYRLCKSPPLYIGEI